MRNDVFVATLTSRGGEDTEWFARHGHGALNALRVARAAVGPTPSGVGPNRMV
jgi:hypothetical protein